MPPIRKEITPSAIVSFITLACLLVGGAWFIFPLRDLPANQRSFDQRMRHFEHTQTVQTEALKTLADIASDTKQMRRDVDQITVESRQNDRSHEAEILRIRGRLESIERRQ
jgi:hypothetical protein